MSEPLPPSPPPEAAIPEYRAAQRWNVVWVVPVIALIVGAWMIYRSVSARGPVAHVRFETANGIAAGKTEVRCRSVRVGFVKQVTLADDLKSVIIRVELEEDSERLLRQGTRFWVVRPRVSTTDISGLGTLITGAYLELDPGPRNGPEVNHFDGQETPPATSRDIPGRRIVLHAEQAGSLVPGSPVYYRGFEVGRIESRVLDIANERVTYDAFIRAEYSPLVKENTRFWNTSGIDISAGTDGFKLRTPSFQAMVSGGASFGVPEGNSPGNAVADGTIFTLFKSEDDATNSTFNPSMKFLLLFDQSVRGLSKSAPVEFRGIQIGRVADISFDYLHVPTDSRIPVLIELDPSLLRPSVAEVVGKPDDVYMAESVARGLRAALKTGSLLTGAKFVDLDYYKDARPASIGKVGDYNSLPTVPGGLDQLETKLTAILDKIQALPIDDTMKKFGDAATEATATLAEVKETAAAARKTLDSAEFAKLPTDLRATLAALDKSISSVGPDGSIQGDLLRTLEELRAALRSMKGLTNSIEEKPNSLLFGRDSTGNPIPRAPRGKR